jgi:thiamine pyrophosphate-dependent acetolactate synthase large subunit-like protein
MRVADAVGRLLAAHGVERVFGVVGSGNFHVTNALVAAGAEYVAARHEAGAATMADAYARMAGQVGVATVHQGPGLTNAMTGITEAAKSRTPLLVLAADTAAGAVRSNFRIDQDSLVTAVGAVAERVHGPDSVVEDVARAYRQALAERRTVVLNLPLDVQAAEVKAAAIESAATDAALPAEPAPAPTAGPEAVAALATLLSSARRPVFVAGRGARAAGGPLRELAAACGALLATSAVAKGLFAGDPYDLDISGGFASPLAAELIGGADVLVGWGCALNMWTMRHGRLVGPDTTVVQVDLEEGALGAHRPVDLGVVGDVALTATAVLAVLSALARDSAVEYRGYRGPELAARIAAEVQWRDVPYDDLGGDGRIDPRTLTVAVDGMLPAERIVAVDSGNFMGYPSMYLSVPDQDGFCFTQAYQSIGLGLASAVGAALARPDRLPVAAVGDGGLLMSAAELDTVARLDLGMLVLVYDDEAYGAEVHHFGPAGAPLDTVRFPPADLAAIGRGYGLDALTVREPADLAPVADWVANRPQHGRSLLVDAKVASDGGSWWLAEAFRGH